MREEALFEIQPDALDRVYFGRVGWQRNQGNVGRHGEGIRAMPACLIEHHHRMFVISDGFGKAVEEGLHRRRIGIGHQQCESVIGAWLHGREDIGEGEALIAEPRRTLPALPPDMTDAALLADARLVLEEQAKALLFMRTLNFFQKRRSPF